MYLTGDINQQAGTPSANSGWPTGVTYYPPLSIFAADKRFGTGAALSEVNIEGQLTSLANEGDTVDPLVLKDGSGSIIAGTRIAANLSQIRSPAQLPPVNKMTWLVVIEEIQAA